MWTLPDAQLGSVVTPLSHPQILPQAMTVCQWLLRMWWEWELQDHVQHKPSVSWICHAFCELALPSGLFVQLALILRICVATSAIQECIYSQSLWRIIGMTIMCHVTSFHATPINSLAVSKFHRLHHYVLFHLAQLSMGIVDISFQSAGTGKYDTPTRHLKFHFAPLEVSYELFPQ